MQVWLDFPIRFLRSLLTSFLSIPFEFCSMSFNLLANVDDRVLEVDVDPPVFPMQGELFAQGHKIFEVQVVGVVSLGSLRSPRSDGSGRR